MPKGKKATAQDAQVLMQLYDLRRETVIRAARKYMTAEFWPMNYEEFRALMFEFGTERNAFARQCLTYWDMAAAMVLHGAVHEELFFAGNGEPYFLYAKYGEYLPQLRKEFFVPDYLVNLEKLAKRPLGKERVKALKARVDARRAAAAAAKAGKPS
jgi:hypothetical protein